MKMYDEHKKAFMSYTLNSDLRQAVDYFKNLLNNGEDPNLLIQMVIDPVLRELGLMWGKGNASLAQTFVGSKITEEIYNLCLPAESEGLQQKKGIVVIGNIEDDFHSLGRKIVASYLKVCGWELIDLGNDVPAEDFVETSIQNNFAIIAISAMMHTTALNIKKVRALIDEKGLKNKIMLAVGGAVFNWKPELVEEVGGDGTADNAILADTLLSDLLQRRSL